MKAGVVHWITYRVKYQGFTAVWSTLIPLLHSSHCVLTAMVSCYPCVCVWSGWVSNRHAWCGQLMLAVSCVSLFISSTCEQAVEDCRKISIFFSWVYDKTPVCSPKSIDCLLAQQFFLLNFVNKVSWFQPDYRNKSGSRNQLVHLVVSVSKKC